MKNVLNKLILGTVQFGLDYGINNPSGKIEEEEIVKILSLCEDSGINKLDTSYAYGESETVLGKTANHNFSIISKYPRTKENVEIVFADTLIRLKRDKIYGYLVHNFDFYLERPSIWEDMIKLKEKQFIEKIGFSLYKVEELEYLLDKDILFDLIQFPYNIFDKSFEPYLKLLHQRNVEIHVRSVFLQGLFFKKPDELSGKLKTFSPYIKELKTFCDVKEIEIEELALNNIIHNPYIDGVLIGVDNVLQLKRNILSIWKEESAEICSFVNSIFIKEKELLNPVNWK